MPLHFWGFFFQLYSLTDCFNESCQFHIWNSMKNVVIVMTPLYINIYQKINLCSAFYFSSPKVLENENASLSFFLNGFLKLRLIKFYQENQMRYRNISVLFYSLMKWYQIVVIVKHKCFLFQVFWINQWTVKNYSLIKSVNNKQ